MDEQMKTGETGDKNAVIDQKLRQFFDGKIVRKDLTKKIKEGANVPVYVLEFLLGQYCSSDDPEVIETGVENVKRILADNYVRPDEAQKILSMLRQRGMHTVIDKITVNLNMKKDTYEAEFSNLGIKNIPISEDYPAKFDRLLCGGIWCIVQLEYEFLEEDKNASPIHIRKLTPIQMPHVDIEELKEGRKNFTEEEWLEIMLRSCGYEPDKMQRTILKIQEIVNAEPFSAKEARNEICAINLEHPENLVIYGLLFSQNSSGTRIVDADKECLICDLQWKQYYLSAKCVGKSIDEMRKELCGEAEHF